MSSQAKGLVAVLIVSGLLGLAWFKYSEFLNQGRSAPISAKKLNELEANGVPDFNLKTIDGVDVSLSNFRDKLVILNFWASWCNPCVDEFPSLMKLIDRFKGEIVLIALSADYEEKDIRTFLKAFKVQSQNIYVIWDKDYAVAKQFGTAKLPESYVIGYRGQLIRKISGVDDWSTPEAYEYFTQLLETKKTGH
jgi:cytochrome c biogenesis protein CcmG/thiol:disulfide interchange protein DsbE